MRTLVTVSLVALLLSCTVPVLAQEPGHTCPHGGDTIADLQSCVNHAAAMGHIDNDGILRSLHAKLDAAQAALDRGQPAVAVNNLEALVRAVAAQAGKQIDAHHAAHMVEHTERVIAALG